MDEELQTLLQKQLEIPALSNMAIVRCRKAMERVAREMLTDLGLLSSGSRQLLTPKELADQYDMQQLREQAAEAFKRAANAYREAMPPLTGAGNIRDFIACVGHGMLLNVFKESEATKLLYAAQIAHAAENKRYKSQFETF